MKTYRELLNIDLPKKINLLITGDKIDSESASEIIRRTDVFFFGRHSNDLENINKTRQLLGLPIIKEIKDFKGDLLLYHEHEKKRRNNEQEYYKKYNIIKTEYVSNEWICPKNHTPNGWCHPDGTISFSGEIGDWPTTKEFLDDFIAISNTFPFLKMNASIFDKNQPLVNFKISKGYVTILDAYEMIINIEDIKEYAGEIISLKTIKEWI